MVRELNQLISGFLQDTEAVIPKLNPSYGKEAKKADDPLQTWRARACQANVKDGIVTVTGQGPAPFLGVAPGAKGPGVVTFRSRSAARWPGKDRMAPTGAGGKATDPQSVPYTVKAGDWQETSVTIPAKGPLGIIRLYLPSPETGRRGGLGGNQRRRLKTALGLLN